MPDITTIHRYTCDLAKGTLEVRLHSPLMHQDALADEFRVSVFSNGAPVTLTGVSVAGCLYIAATRQTLPLTGAIVDGCASVTLTDACYAVPGYCSVAVILQHGSVRHTLLKADCCIARTGSDSVIDPDGVLPSLTELLGMIGQLESATEEARAVVAGHNATLSGSLDRDLRRSYDGTTRLPAHLFQIGTILETGLFSSDAKATVATPEVLCYPHPVTLAVADYPYMYQVVTYNDDGTLLNYGAMERLEQTIPANTPFRVAINNNSVAADVEDLCAALQVLPANGSPNTVVTDGALNAMLRVAEGYFKWAYNLDGSSPLLYGAVEADNSLWNRDMAPVLSEDGVEQYSINCSGFANALLQAVPYRYSRFALGADAENQHESWGFQYDDTVRFGDLGEHAGFDDPVEHNNLGYAFTYDMYRYAQSHGFAYTIAEDLSNIRPGDVLFVSRYDDTTNNYYKRYRGISHCAICLAVDRINKKIIVIHSTDAQYRVLGTTDTYRDVGVNIAGVSGTALANYRYGARFPVGDVHNPPELIGRWTSADGGTALLPNVTRGIYTVIVKGNFDAAPQFRFKFKGENIGDWYTVTQIDETTYMTTRYLMDDTELLYINKSSADATFGIESVELYHGYASPHCAADTLLVPGNVMQNRKALAEDADFDAITTDGIYYAYVPNTQLNRPESGAGILTVTTQKSVTTQDWVNIQTGARYARYSVNGEWRPWVSVPTDATLSKSGVAADAAAVGQRFSEADERMTALQNEKAPAITDTMEGAVCTTNRMAAGMRLPGLMIYGRTLQSAVPSPAAPVDLISAGAEDRAITVTLAGKNLADMSAITRWSYTVVEQSGDAYRIYTSSPYTWQGIRGNHLLLCKGVRYTFSVTVDEIVSGTISCGLRRYDSNAFLKSVKPTDTGRWSCTYTPTEDVEAYWSILVTGSTAEDGDATFRDAQLEVGRDTTEYTGYHAAVQELPMPSTGLPGIPVSSGGNYTDASGQQWIADVLCCDYGKVIRHVQTVTLDGDAVMRRKTNASGINQFYYKCSSPQAGVTNALCNYVPYGTSGTGVCLISSDGYFVLRLPDELQATTEEEFAAMRAQTPLVFQYAIQPQTAWLLNESVIEQYNALLSASPDATLYNSAGAWMHASYPADTGRYIHDKSGGHDESAVYYAFGDSTTYGQIAVTGGQSKYNYPACVGRALGMQVVNKGVGGQGLLKDWDFIHSEYLDGLDMSDASLVTIGWAYNDGTAYYSQINFGTCEDTTPDTFIGRYYTIMKEFQEKCPQAQIILVTGYGMSGDYPQFKEGYQFADGVKRVQVMYNTLEEMCNFHGWCCVNQAKGSWITKHNWSQWIGDNIHPTNEGYLRYGSFMAARIGALWANLKAW